MTAALRSGHLGAGFWERLKAAAWHGGTECILHSDGQSYAAQQYKRELKKTEANRDFTSDFVSKGLWTPSDVSRCTMSDQEGSPVPCIKYPLHKEVEPGTSLLQRHSAPLPPLVVDDKSGYEKK